MPQAIIIMRPRNYGLCSHWQGNFWLTNHVVEFLYSPPLEQIRLVENGLNISNGMGPSKIKL